MHASNQSEAQILRFPGLEIDLASYEIRGPASTSPLSTKEFQLLSILARNPNRVFHADHLFDLIWGLEGLGDTRTVAVHINTLRKKIETDPSQPKYILTVRGAGYKFNAPKST